MHSESVQKHESSRRAEGTCLKEERGSFGGAERKQEREPFFGVRGREQALQSKGCGKATRGRRGEEVRDVPSLRQGNESWHLSVLLPLSTHTLSLFRPSFSPQPPPPGMKWWDRQEERKKREERKSRGGRGGSRPKISRGERGKGDRERERKPFKMHGKGLLCTSKQVRALPEGPNFSPLLSGYFIFSRKASPQVRQ